MRRLVVVLSALAVLLTFAPVASGATQWSCSNDFRVLLYENKINDTSDNDDRLWVCGGADNLAEYSHTLPGGCKAGYVSYDNWNDCVSSVKPYYPTGWKACFYVNEDYNGAIPGIGTTSGSRLNMPNGYNDSLSSVVFKYSWATC